MEAEKQKLKYIKDELTYHRYDYYNTMTFRLILVEICSYLGRCANAYLHQQTRSVLKGEFRKISDMYDRIKNADRPEMESYRKHVISSLDTVLQTLES
jgi:hypothetical protein